MNENPLIMVLHGAIIAVILFVIMKYVLQQSNTKALARSVLFGLLAASYMIIFGHGLPTKVNANL